MITDKNKKLSKKNNIYYSKAAHIQYFNIAIKSGNGAKLKDENNHQYIDLLASASATNAGHSHPHVVNAIQEQAAKLIQYIPAYFINKPAVDLSERLTNLSPIKGPKKLAWGNSGSDANDAIIKYARAYTNRQNIVSYTGAYHGSTYGSISMSAVNLNMSRKIGPLLPGVIKVPYPDPWSHLKGENENDFVNRMFDEFKRPFETYLPPEEVAVIEMEPIQGDGGIIKAPTKYVQKVYNFAHEHGILFAIDEVNQGLGRSGKMWSIDHFPGVYPDLMSVGKSLASGLPLSAVIGKKEIMDSLSAPANAYTTAGNPVTTAAASATLDVIDNENLVSRSRKLGNKAKNFFEQEKQKYNFIGDIRMYGLNGGIDIINPQTKESDVAASTKLIYRMFQLGALMITIRGNVLRFQPPLVIKRSTLKQAFKIIDQAMNDLANNQIKMPKNADHIGWTDKK